MPTSKTLPAANLLDGAFANTQAFQQLKPQPLCYMDVGAAGGMPEELVAIAPLVQIIFFEPDDAEYERVLAGVRTQGFASVHGVQTALGHQEGEQRLHLTRSGVNSSLLRLNEMYWRRYGITGGEVVRTIDVQCSTLDRAVAGLPHLPEIIKTDCQGLDCDILSAAPNALANAVCIVCEIIFPDAYHGQKGISDIAALLKGHGFALYGLTPHYISRKNLDRRHFETNERLMYVDGIFFKDPLYECTSPPSLTPRQWLALYLSACVYGYYDFAIELSEHMLEGQILAECARGLSARASQNVLEKLQRLLATAPQVPEDQYLLAKAFADDVKGSNDIAYIKAVRDRELAGLGKA